MTEETEEKPKTPEEELYLARIDLIVAAVLTVVCGIILLVMLLKGVTDANSRRALIVGLMFAALIVTLIIRVTKFFKWKKAVDSKEKK